MDQEKSFFKSTAGIAVIVIAILCCCCAVLMVGGAGSFFYLNSQSTVDPDLQPTSMVEFPVEGPTETASPVPTLEVTEVSADTLTTLENTLVPENNPRDLACRLKGICNIPETLLSGPFSAGDQQKFWVLNGETIEYRQVDATLVYVTDVAYFWVEDGVRFSQREAEELVDAFSQKMVPTNREFFGMEPSPGIDGDPRIYLLYVTDIGNSTAGYFYSNASLHPLVDEYSSAHEMFVFNADNSPLSEEYTYGVLAHEFQHMIHHGRDRNETSWLNEGFSELAVLLNGYSTGLKDYEYASNPDLQLTDWGADVGLNGPHYGASFLFTTYFLDRFGKEATQALVRDPANSMDSVDQVLESIGAIDPLSGQPIRADDLFMDWAVTNYLLDEKVADGRYDYKTYRSASNASKTETFSDCPIDYSGTVNQYGVDYFRITCNGQFTLRFQGSTATTLLPMEAHSGKMAFWSNKGDESDMTLTRAFDFSGASGPLTLQYQTWYDIEAGWDYVYLEASTDGGQTWQILITPSGTADDPAGNSYGWGYTGSSRGWREESVDLSQFAGQKVQLRFEYVTDAAVNGEGLLLDDISIPEINYSADFESDDGGWQAAGFARIENALPQTFRLALISKGGETIVQTITVNPDQTAEISVDLGGEVDEVTLVVSGVTRFTRGEGSYTISIK